MKTNLWKMYLARPETLGWKSGGGRAQVLRSSRRVHAREGAERAVRGEDVEERRGRLHLLPNRRLPLRRQVQHHARREALGIALMIRLGFILSF